LKQSNWRDFAKLLKNTPKKDHRYKGGDLGWCERADDPEFEKAL